MIFAGICVLINIGLALTLFPLLSARGIVIAEITSGWVNTLLLCSTLIKRGYWKCDIQLIKWAICLIIAILLMAAALYYALDFLAFPLSSQAPLFLRIGTLAGLIFSILLFYCIICFFLGMNYFPFLRKNLKQHL